MLEHQIVNLESMISRATEDLRLALTLYRNESRCAAAESKPLPHRDFWGTLRLNLLELHRVAEELCDEMHAEFSPTTTAASPAGKNVPATHPALPFNTYVLYVRGARGQDVTVWSIEGVSAQISRYEAIRSFGGTNLLDNTYGRGRWKLEFAGRSEHNAMAIVIDPMTDMTNTVTDNHVTWDGCPPGSDTITYHRCDNCSATLTQSQLQPITDLHERLDTDQEPMIFPSGQCPLCSALCYPLKE